MSNISLFKTLYDIIPNMLVRVIFNIDVKGDGIKYGDIITCAGDARTYCVSEMNYLLLINTINEVKNGTVADKISKKIDLNKEMLKGSVYDINRYVEQLKLLEYFDRLRDCTRDDSFEKSIKNFSKRKYFDASDELNSIFFERSMSKLFSEYEVGYDPIEKSSCESLCESSCEEVEFSYCKDGYKISENSLKLKQYDCVASEHFSYKTSFEKHRLMHLHFISYY